VTGKRALIHSDAAPAERDRLGMYWYELLPTPPDAASARGPRGSTGSPRPEPVERRAEPTWSRHVIEEGGRMGGGLQIVVIDIDGDGALDVVSSGKTGLFLAENVSHKARRP
jgi:hypothetical protein